MKTKMKTYPFYITLQACVAITFVFVIIMTVRYSSSSVAFFEIKPEAVAKITSLFDQQQQAGRDGETQHADVCGQLPERSPVSHVEAVQAGSQGVSQKETDRCCQSRPFQLLMSAFLM